VFCTWRFSILLRNLSIERLLALGSSLLPLDRPLTHKFFFYSLATENNVHIWMQVIKSIIREIVAICAERGTLVNEDLTAFMVKAVVLNPDSGFKSDAEMTRDDIGELVEVSANANSAACGPASQPPPNQPASSPAHPPTE
jgi:hypothetical protein